MKLSGVINIDKSYVHAKDQGQKLKFKVKFKMNFAKFKRFWKITPVSKIAVK